MKKVNKLILLLVTGTMLATSCGKDGATGPQGPAGTNGATGPTGAQGPVGPAGPAGTNGTNGSVIYSGATAPATSLGTVGDFYLNKSNSLFYGPKTAAGWGTGFSLMGATGATGATGAIGATGAAGINGSTILSGNGVPVAALGNTGDYYLDKTTYLFYGPKAAAGWGTATALQGPAGPIGPQGPAGTANVQYSGWNYATNFRDTTIDNSLMHVADLAAPALTQTLLDGGSMQIFLDYGGGVFPLPHTAYAGGKASIISYLPRIKHFIITRFTLDNTNSVNLSTAIQYRYILIPGGHALAAIKNAHINMNDYNALTKFFRIGN